MELTVSNQPFVPMQKNIRGAACNANFGALKQAAAAADSMCTATGGDTHEVVTHSLQ
jgi:hypothetical protein